MGYRLLPLDPKDRLKVYNKMLFHYVLSLVFPFLKGALNTNTGFCNWYYGRYLSNGMSVDLPELYAQKPACTNGFWYDQSVIYPRIKLLIRAIKKYKEDNHE